VKTAIIVTPGGPEEHTLSVVIDEAKKAGMPVFTHAVTDHQSSHFHCAGPKFLARPNSEDPIDRFLYCCVVSDLRACAGPLGKSASNQYSADA
jgi:hypothetical protein